MPTTDPEWARSRFIWAIDRVIAGARIQRHRLQWYIAGYLDPAFNNNIYWSRGCQPFQQIDVTVVYTDPTGAPASKTKTPMCWYVTP
jgi:hypothetical protein